MKYFRTCNDEWRPYKTYKLIPKHNLTSQKLINTYHIYNSFEMKSKHMKTSHSNSQECKPFTHGFMIFRLTKNMEIILHIHESYITSPSASNSYKCPHTNMLCNSFQNGSQIHENQSFQSMGMQAFHTCIYDILPYRSYGHDITDP